MEPLGTSCDMFQLEGIDIKKVNFLNCSDFKAMDFFSNF
jgi:hypothetical protein